MARARLVLMCSLLAMGATSARTASADDEDDDDGPIANGAAIISPAPGAKVPLGKKLLISFKAPKGSTNFKCVLYQHERHVTLEGTPVGDARTCRVEDFEAKDTMLRPGRAKLSMHMTVDGKLAVSPKIEVELTSGAVAPQGGAGTKFDAKYWRNHGGSQGQLYVQTVTIKNGIAELALSIRGADYEPVISLGTVRAVIDKDGTISPQTAKVTTRKPMRGKKVFENQQREADLTTQVEISGKVSATSDGLGHPLDLRVEGATLPGELRPNYIEGHYYRFGEKGDTIHGCDRNVEVCDSSP